MGRSRAETIQIAPELLRRSGDGVALTAEILRDYIAKLREYGRSEESIKSCGRTLRQFYDFLPEDKRIGKDTLPHWREQLLAEGYAARSVNSKVSMVNALLACMNCREFQVAKQLPTEVFDAPELTRQEYIRMLQTAKLLDDERAYALTKLFATTGIAVQDLPLVTVEAAQDGEIALIDGKTTKTVHLPDGLRGDLLRYAAKSGRTRGMIFTKKDGSPLARTQVGLFIQKLAQEAGLPAEKGNIRALRQLHRATVSAIEADFELLIRQAYEQQLALDEQTARWEE